MPVIDNLNNGQKANGVPFMDLPEEESPSDYGYLVVTNDVTKLKRITKGDFYKGKYSGGNILTGDEKPTDDFGHDGDVYIETTPSNFSFSLSITDNEYDTTGRDTRRGETIESIGESLGEDLTIVADHIEPIDPEIRIFNSGGYQNYIITPNQPLYPSGTKIRYTVSFDIETSPGTVVDDFQEGYNPATGEQIGGTFMLFGYTTGNYWKTSGGEGSPDWQSTDPLPTIGELYTRTYVESGHEHVRYTCIRCGPGLTHVERSYIWTSGETAPEHRFTISLRGIDLYYSSSARVYIKNLRFRSSRHESYIKNIWIKKNGVWNEDDFSPLGEIGIDSYYDTGVSLASIGIDLNTYYIKSPNNMPVDETAIIPEYNSGTELFYIDIDGQRTRVYNPPSEYEVGYLQGYRSTDPNGRKIYTDEISTLPINGLTTTYSGSTRFIAKRNALYKVVFHMNIYKNDRGNLICYTNKESFYAKLDMANPTWSWVDGPPEVRIPAKDFEGTRFSVYTELIGYIETNENSNEEIPRFILDIGGKNFMYSNSYEIMVYFNTVITRIR